MKDKDYEKKKKSARLALLPLGLAGFFASDKAYDWGYEQGKKWKERSEKKKREKEAKKKSK